MSEFLVMMALLTIVGLLIMKGMSGSSNGAGAINTITKTATNQVASDPD